MCISIVNEYNKTYQKTIKTKPVNVKDNTYIESTELRSNNKYRKFKIGGHLRSSKQKKIFLLKDTHQIGLKKFS